MKEFTILDLSQKMEAGELTARAIVEDYLARIEAIDKQGPTVNAIIELNPDALAIADKLDEERKAGKVRGLLHGIPILIKDNIDTHDRMQTTAGSLALEGAIAPQDSFIVARLRAVGAVILGKTNLSEWANFRGKPSVSGWSSRGGLTRNPYALDRTACGSSSGSGVAVAANLCAAAVGTETNGSIICPSQINGIVGIKPTVGLVSRSGIVPISHSQDTAGPMARTVADAAILLGALTGIDKEDVATLASETHVCSDYRPFLDVNGLQGARIGVARAMAGSNSRINQIFEFCIDLMHQQGAIIIDSIDLPDPKELNADANTVLDYEFKAALNQYLQSRRPKTSVQTLADVIQFNEENKDRVMPYFGQERHIEAQRKGTLTSQEYLDALARNHHKTREAGIDAVMEKHNLDAIIVPSGGPAWLIDLVGGDAKNWDVNSTTIAAVAGYPHITVPAGYIFGLPVGISFIGQAWKEPTLIKLAYAFEQASGVRKPPSFLKTVNLAL